MKKILILMLSVVMVFALSVSLFSCGDTECTTHVDENNDGKCDNCSEEMPVDPDSGKVTLTTHEQFMAAEAGAEITVETYVQAKQGWWNDDGVDVASFYTENEEGGYFIYNMPCTEAEYNALVPGTKILVKGYKVIFNGLHEIGDATFEILGGTYVAEPADITDKLATEDIINYQSMKYVAKNLTVVEFKDGQGFGYGWDGNSNEGADIYFNLSDGTNTYSFLVETYLSGNDSEVYEAAKALKVGDLVTVEGFVYWYEGFQAHVTSIENTPSMTAHEKFMAAEAGAEITVETYVQAKQGWWNDDGVDVASFYTENEEGGYFIYNMPCTEAEYNALVPGTKILVKGYKVIFNGLHEIGDATFEILGGTYVAEPADITDKLATEDIVNYQGMKYVAKSLSVVEFKDGKGFGYGWDGNGEDGADIYFKLTDGTNTYSFVIETYLSGTDSDVYAAAKALEVGDVVTVEGFVYWYEGFQAHVTSITVETDTPAN